MNPGVREIEASHSLQNMGFDESLDLTASSCFYFFIFNEVDINFIEATVRHALMPYWVVIEWM